MNQINVRNIAMFLFYQMYDFFLFIIMCDSLDLSLNYLSKFNYNLNFLVFPKFPQCGITNSKQDTMSYHNNNKILFAISVEKKVKSLG